jgi:hypothetical protein
VADPSHVDCTSSFSLGFQARENQRVQSMGQGSDTRAVLFLSYTTKSCKISSFITKNKDFYDKILQNTYLYRPESDAICLCEQCKVHQKSDRNSLTTKQWMTHDWWRHAVLAFDFILMTQRNVLHFMWIFNHHSMTWPLLYIYGHTFLHTCLLCLCTIKCKPVQVLQAQLLTIGDWRPMKQRRYFTK